MKANYDQSLRVKGGNGFSSAMFRYTAAPREYSKRLGEQLIEKMNLSDSVKIHDSETHLIIAVNQVPKLITDYEFVETKRQEGVYAYENWLKEVILESTSNIN